MRAKEEKWERQICLAFSGAKENMVGEKEAKPRVKQTEAWVRRRVGSIGVSPILPWGVLLGKGLHGPSRGEVHEAG